MKLTGKMFSDFQQKIKETTPAPKCEHCEGAGSYYLETGGYDRDSIGGWVSCWPCKGTGKYQRP